MWWLGWIGYGKSSHKEWNNNSQFTFPYLLSLSLRIPTSTPGVSFSPISPLLIVFACLTSPAHPLHLLNSLHRVEDLLADPDPTHKRRVDNQLPLSSGLNRSSSKFPCHGILSESGLLPIIPHLLRCSFLIFGSLIPAPFGLSLSHPAVTKWTQFSLRLGYTYCVFMNDWIM